MASDLDRAKHVIQRKTDSFTWVETNYWSEWETAWKNMKSVRDMEKDPDGKEDPELSHIGSPITWGYIQRTVARGTAQPPNLRFHCKDPELSELISRTLMYQWDKAKIQRQQKKHFRQALLFGWSVRPWYWSVDERIRMKRIDIGQPLNEVQIQEIAATYQLNPRFLMMPELQPRILSNLLAKNSRGRLLPVRYNYRSYEGPKCDFLFVGDCYPEPNFQSLQTSNWFIVERRRNEEWIKSVAKAFPELKKGFDELLKKYPDGTERRYTADQRNLRNRMLSAISRTEETDVSSENRAKEWTITEQHTPGENPRMAFVGEDDVWIGEIPYPYDLEGQIAFSECVLIDDLLAGVGDSVARIMRGLHLVHERQVNRRLDLVYNLVRPLLGTSNRELMENPEAIKRHAGFRMVYMRGPGDLWIQPEQAAMASAVASLNDEASIMRLYQVLTGESNMSMMANVDPQQNKTATGAKLLQFNQDVLTKDLNDMFATTSLSHDAELMYLLNRSELSDAIEFESARYNRIYSAQEDSIKQKWVRVEPLHFQVDGEIVAEAGSTLADDDDTRVGKAREIAQIAFSRPDLFNQMKARDDYLIAMGKGRELPAWAAPPPPPPPPPEVRSNVTVTAKWAELSEEERQFFKSKIQGIQMQIEPPAPEPEAAPPGPNGQALLGGVA